jgi:hypothetical protein
MGNRRGGMKCKFMKKMEEENVQVEDKEGGEEILEEVGGGDLEEERY